MGHRPIMVMGPGRCGSSSVARILHTRLGVAMGTSFAPADRHNPGGYYEDLDFVFPNKFFLDGRLTYPEWRKMVLPALDSRTGPWGFKDPRLAYLGGLYFGFCRWRVVRVCRELSAVVASMQRCYGWDEKEATIETRQRERHIDNLVRDLGKDDLCWLRMNNEPDERIVEQLEQWL